jgi:hypothetical protein
MMIFGVNYCCYLVRSDVYYWISINIGLVHLLGVSYELERQSMAYFIKEKTAEVTIKKYFNLEIDLANKQISEGKRDLDLKRKMVRHCVCLLSIRINT